MTHAQPQRQNDPARRVPRRHFLRLTGAVIGSGLFVPWVHSAGNTAAGPRVRREVYGKTPDGVEVHRFILSSGAGLEAAVMTYGATLTTVSALGRDGKPAVVTLFLDTLDDYVRGHPLFGSVVGRYANRIANARLAIDGTEYPLEANAKPHHIHGGNAAPFHKALWKAEAARDGGDAAATFTHASRDGEGGYPGTVEASVTYKVTADNALVMEYGAKTDKPTHVNLTNHAYWNLTGAGSGDVLGHVLTLHADRYLSADKAKIPTGELADVKGTPMDFTRPQPVGSRIKQVEGENYDHCYVVRKKEGAALSPCARVVDPASGRTMEVETTQPGVQLYTARGLNDRLKGGGKPYGPYHGLCLETQHYPDSPNKPAFPTTLLRPGQAYRQVTVHRFGVERQE
jgi:aldose 1-epimerase